MKNPLRLLTANCFCLSGGNWWLTGPAQPIVSTLNCTLVYEHPQPHPHHTECGSGEEPGGQGFGPALGQLTCQPTTDLQEGNLPDDIGCCLPLLCQQFWVMDDFLQKADHFALQFIVCFKILQKEK